MCLQTLLMVGYQDLFDSILSEVRVRKVLLYERQHPVHGLSWICVLRQL